MAKRSRVSLERKKELNQPDAFMTMSGKVISFAKTYKNHFMVAIGVFCALMICIAGYRFISERNKVKASAALAGSLAQYRAAVVKDGPVNALAAVEPQLLDLADSYSATPAGKTARLALGNMYYAAGDYDKAIASHLQSLAVLEKDSALTSLVYYNLGYAHESKGDQQKAF